MNKYMICTKTLKLAKNSCMANRVCFIKGNKYKIYDEIPVLILHTELGIHEESGKPYKNHITGKWLKYFKKEK